MKNYEIKLPGSKIPAFLKDFDDKTSDIVNFNGRYFLKI
jgi:hypothetical protein